ncbi:DNA-binding protein [Burkholderia sp. Bp9012]|uniref:DNA-binding protein n=1 Tax=Burkholderia sp. Bp9012 TaxID=2184562 RepID=UPI000F598B59|nr:DNA-binding protein [Burkholderia sp. Bp9012]RQR68968.1 DNA-binding protein [Burkholderia sp. Bp9012]
MKKSEIIANCLVNMDIGMNATDAETRVQQIFVEEFPDDSYHLWNTDVDNALAHDLIKQVGRASKINVRLFILDLW